MDKIRQEPGAQSIHGFHWQLCARRLRIHNRVAAAARFLAATFSAERVLRHKLREDKSSRSQSRVEDSASAARSARRVCSLLLCRFLE